MNKNIITGLAALFLLASASALALDTSEPVLCASIDVHECVDGGACSDVLPEDVNAPTFFRIDLKKQTVRVTKSGDPEEAANFDRLSGRYVLQGVDHGAPDDTDGVAWSIQIEEDTARLAATALTRQAAIIIFGACTEY